MLSMSTCDPGFKGEFVRVPRSQWNLRTEGKFKEEGTVDQKVLAAGEDIDEVRGREARV